jgi:hypothetical protein
VNEKIRGDKGQQKGKGGVQTKMISIGGVSWGSMKLTGGVSFTGDFLLVKGSGIIGDTPVTRGRYTKRNGQLLRQEMEADPASDPWYHYDSASKSWILHGGGHIKSAVEPISSRCTALTYVGK